MLTPNAEWPETTIAQFICEEVDPSIEAAMEFFSADRVTVIREMEALLDPDHPGHSASAVRYVVICLLDHWTKR